MISAINGTGGVGKTWLALTWAHRHLNRFPDGQLFADLRGFSPTDQPTASEDVLRGFLEALGVDRDRQPSQLDAQASLYRSLVAGKRMLILLDNAATSDQILPLLPGTGTSTVLITSRNRLPALLTSHGVRPLQLDVFTDAESRSLLAASLGLRRVATEKNAVTELIELCGGFPLALGLIIARAGAEPHLPLEEAVAALRDLGLDALDSDEPAASVPAVLSWSLRWLNDRQRTIFALLGVAPGPDIGLPAAANLTCLSTRELHAVLRTLVDASLIERASRNRYAMHDFVRAYATNYARETISEPILRAALERVVDFYMHTADAARRLLAPHADVIRPEPFVPGVQPHPLFNQPAAIAWLDTEHRHLLAAQRTAAIQHRHRTVWHLAWTLTVFHRRRGHRHDELTVWQVALDAAAHLPDPATHIRTHRYLGTAHIRLGQHEQAAKHLYEALTRAEQRHDTAQRANAHFDLAAVWEQRGDDRTARDHAQHALDFFHALGNPVWQADALNLVGWYAARLGEYDRARDHCEAALSLHRQHHNTRGEATTLDSLGYIHHNTGRHHQSINHYRQAITLRRNLADTYRVADTLDSLGHPYVALGLYDRAYSLWREALTLYQEQGRTTDAERVQKQLNDLDVP